MMDDADIRFLSIPHGPCELLPVNKIGDDIKAIQLQSQPVFVWNAENVTVYSDSAVNVGGELKWIGLISRHYEDLSKVTRPKPKSFHMERCAFVGGSENFGHAIFEGLTRIAVLNLAGYGNLPIALWPNTKVRGFLDMASIPYFIVEPPCHFSDVVIPSCPVGRDLRQKAYGWRDAIWWVRNRFLPKAPMGKRRIYARRYAPTRKILNEFEITQTLAGLGFQCLDLSSFPLAEQIQMVSECEVLVLAGGAGSPISCFARCPVIEMTPNCGSGIFGATIFCGTFGLPYLRLNGIETTDDVNADYTISISDLKAAVALALDKGYP